MEEKIYQEWLKSGFFNPDRLKDAKKPYSIHLPPPNITGSLHMGHALNATLSDVLIRYHRMKGFKTVWFPGTDHAGIATQNAVEKQLKKEGLNRWELGREKFIARVWQWRNQYGDIIIGQLKKLGASCDWSRLRFTMDPRYSEWVNKTFIHYYKKGWIYRDLRTVNWCVRCQTSLSDLEIEYKEENAILYYIKYGPITLATVRPETKFGDTAIAVHPQDKRYKKYIGKELEIESLDVSGSLDNPRKIKIMIIVVGDRAVDQKFGGGAIKVTPAHDITDFEIAQRHKIPLIQVIDERGRMNEKAGKYAGMKVAEARKKIAEDLRSVGLLVKEELYHHRTAACYRCDSVLEPLPSKQWFLKMEELARTATSAVKGKKTSIIPKNFEKLYFNWLNNVRDWCVSRQIWWGHRLPVWFHELKCVPLPGKEKEVGRCEEMIVSVTQPKCRHCAAKFIQSEDVLDTWFSSSLWPFAGLSKKDLKDFYPSNVLITARDIINLWVGRMIYSGIEFMGKPPFPETLIHATVLTKEGKRMSKSLGTGTDPLELVEKYGADATRFGIIWQTMGGQDIHWDETAVIAGKKFANKVRNASKFVFGRKKISKTQFPISEPKNVKLKFNKDILKQLEKVKKDLEKDLEKYKFGQALHKFYDFFWHSFCDICIEESKKNPDKETDAVLFYVLVKSLKILHPFMPFITEEVWQNTGSKNLLIIEKW